MADVSFRLHALAAACAQRLPAAPGPLHQERSNIGPSLEALLAAVRESDPRFDFDLAGRPAAIRAIRQALPAVEADLFDAVIDDFTCEAAAREEALYQIALAARSGERPDPPDP